MAIGDAAFLLPRCPLRSSNIFGCDKIDVYANVNFCYASVNIGRLPV